MALIKGTELSEVLVGTSKESLLNGLEENDTIIGGAGNDTLDGISGSNSLWGGEGSDSFILRAQPKLNNQNSEVSSFYRDIIWDFSVSGEEQDILRLPYLPNDNRANFSDLVFQDTAEDGIWGTEIQVEFNDKLQGIAFLPQVSAKELNNPALFQSGFRIPETISEPAQNIWRTFTVEFRDSIVPPENLNDSEAWQTTFEFYDNFFAEIFKDVVEELKPTLTEFEIGNVPVVDIKPQGWEDNGKVLIYIHGGFYTQLSPKSTFSLSVPIAEDTGLRVIAVDYTRAPFAQFEQVTDEVISVIQGVKNQGYEAGDIALLGDSSGGALAAGSILKMQDLGLEEPGALVLLSALSDITETGDSYATLKDEEPIVNYDLQVGPSAQVYAPSLDDKLNPYVSPVYGDYSLGFHPTLIQGGAKEIFLSNMLRHARVLDRAGVNVELDIYDGMWHNFLVYWRLPESQLGRNKIVEFLEENFLNDAPLEQNETDETTLGRIFGSENDDLLKVGITPGFDGNGDFVFAGSGNDIVDVTSAAANNHIKDEAGNDLFFLGGDNALFGGDGDDTFFVNTGSGNTITGGAGADSFWLAITPKSNGVNIITDFELGVDILGIGGLDLDFYDLSLTQDGGNTVISSGTQDLVILLGTQSTNLNKANFVFG